MSELRRRMARLSERVAALELGPEAILDATRRLRPAGEPPTDREAGETPGSTLGADAEPLATPPGPNGCTDVDAGPEAPQLEDTRRTSLRRPPLSAASSRFAVRLGIEPEALADAVFVFRLSGALPENEDLRDAIIALIAGTFDAVETARMETLAAEDSPQIRVQSTTGARPLRVDASSKVPPTW